ncbi:MAG: YfiT family bacillithiol transferase [Adhaeribacter sp.]
MIDTLQDDLLRYPIGRFDPSKVSAAPGLEACLQELQDLPAQLRQAVEGLSDAQLDTPYRPGGWTLRQVVHHLADSHMNSYIRFKLALTEDQPAIKPYREDAWADLPDSRLEPVAISLNLLESLHHRWLVVLRSLSPTDWQRSFRHPESGNINLAHAAALYAWHGRHHLAHILTLREWKKW